MKRLLTEHIEREKTELREKAESSTSHQHMIPGLKKTGMNEGQVFKTIFYSLGNMREVS